MYTEIVGKQYYFLAGLHRSGNTVLSAVLNQHPDIYSSPLGPICEYMWLVHNSSHETTIINTFEYRKQQLISSMLDSYYADVEKPIIIDREKNWANPANIEMLKKYFAEKPKIIYTIRPIAEVLASFIAINSNGLIREMEDGSWNQDPNLSLNDNLCEFLMNPNNQIARNLEAIHSIKNSENDGMFHIVQYHDFLNSPQKTMDEIYEFLGIEGFTHNFKNIRKIEEYDDTAAGLPKDLHKIRRQLSKSDVRVNEYVSEYIQNKYSYIDDLFE